MAHDSSAATKAYSDWKMGYFIACRSAWQTSNYEVMCQLHDNPTSGHFVANEMLCINKTAYVTLYSSKLALCTPRKGPAQPRAPSMLKPQLKWVTFSDLIAMD